MEEPKWVQAQEAFKRNHNLDDCEIPEFPTHVSLSGAQQSALNIMILLAKQQQTCNDGTLCNCFIDVQPSIDRMRITHGKVSCLKPTMKLLNLGSRTLVTGKERMALQGLACGDSKEYENLMGYSDSFLRDLAGNAFSAPVCAAVIIATFSVLADSA